jgi:hypothetical protein
MTIHPIRTSRRDDARGAELAGQVRITIGDGAVKQLYAHVPRVAFDNLDTSTRRRRSDSTLSGSDRISSILSNIEAIIHSAAGP